MIHFFGSPDTKVFAIQTVNDLTSEISSKLKWLFGDQPKIEFRALNSKFVGPRAAMITPWSTNAVEITQNMGIEGIIRIEEFDRCESGYTDFDPMIYEFFENLNQRSFNINVAPEPILNITDISDYNKQEGLSLNEDEVNYLNQVSEKIGRPLTDSEVFGFSQVNSEHCRHKIFNGTFIIDGEEKSTSLFKLIKETSKQHPNTIVSVSYTHLTLPTICSV